MVDVDEQNEDEKWILQTLAKGEVADLFHRHGTSYENRPAQLPKVRADVIRELLLKTTGTDANPIRSRGVRICGAHIDGALNLADLSGERGDGLPALVLRRCDIPDPIDLTGTRIARLSIRESRFRALKALEAKIEGNVDFTEARPIPPELGGDGTAHILLDEAKISGNVWGSGAKLVGAINFTDQIDALSMQQAEVGGSIVLDEGFFAIGGVWLLSLKVEHSLEIRDATFKCRMSDADAYVGDLNAARDKGLIDQINSPPEARWSLYLRSARIAGELVAAKNVFEGPICLASSVIGRLCDDSQSGWGSLNDESQIELNDFSVTFIGRYDGDYKNRWELRSRWLARNVGKRRDGQIALFSNQPWRQVTATYVRAGYHREARRLRRRELAEQNKSRRHVHARVKDALRFKLSNPDSFVARSIKCLSRIVRWVLIFPVLWFLGFVRQTFVFLFAELPFGYGLSVTRSVFAVIAVWLAGSVAAYYMLGCDLFPNLNYPRTSACFGGGPYVYSLNGLLPWMNLQSISAIKGTSHATSNPSVGYNLFFNPDWFVAKDVFWRWAMITFRIIGNTVVGFALLTWTGLFAPRDPSR
jgi:hypothetical protein